MPEQADAWSSRPPLTGAATAGEGWAHSTPGRLKRLLIVSDAIAIFAGIVLATWVQYAVRPVSEETVQDQLRLAIVALPLWLTGMGLNRMFTARATLRRREEFERIVRSNLIGIGVLVGLGFIWQFKALSRFWIALVFVCVTATLMISRSLARKVFARMRRNGALRRPIVIIGTGPEAIALLHTTQRRPELGYDVIGFIGDDDIGVRGGVRVLGGIEDAEQILANNPGVGAVLSVDSLSSGWINTLTRQLTDIGVHVSLSVMLQDIAIERCRPQDLDGRMLMYVEPTIRHGWRLALKRVFDIVVASLSLLLALPLLLIAAIAIKLESRGPVLFRQERVGRDGRHFSILKLRTMCVDAEARKDELLEHNEVDGPLFKIAADPRITRVGRLLRKTSVDEFPQFWNVLRGDMSVVGPRPALPEEAAQWNADTRQRLRVLPGITGMWQVSGRSESDFEQYKRLDLYYVDNWSLLHDLEIMLRTIGAVLRARGAS